MLRAVLLLAVSACGRIGFAPVGGDGAVAGDGAPGGAITGVRTQVGYLKAANRIAMMNFGERVATSRSGATVAVATTDEASNATGIDGNGADTSAPQAGAVFVFDGPAWTQSAYLKGTNTEERDEFGSSIAMSGDGNVLVVGAQYEDSGSPSNPADNSFGSAGAVYVFTRSGTWAQTAYLKASNVAPDDRFGASVAISGDGETIAVGAGARANSAGAAYVFSHTTGTWIEQAYLEASNPDAQDEFGAAVALSDDGHTLVVGAPEEASAALGVGGDQLDNSSALSGAAYVFTLGAGWTEQAYIKATMPSSYFGDALALSGDGRTLIVGAPFERNEFGAAYAYARSGTTWTAGARIVEANPLSDDYAGSLALSADGTKLCYPPFNEAGGTGAIFSTRRRRGRRSPRCRRRTPRSVTSSASTARSRATARPWSVAPPARTAARSTRRTIPPARPARRSCSSSATGNALSARAQREPG